MNWRFKPYVSVAKKKSNAKKKLLQLQKKNPNLKPISIAGRTLAHTWWGKAWNDNLEKYADYSNRIGRGRSYLRHGSILDLKISKGKVESLVMGSSSKPYSIEIKISKLNKDKWSVINKKTKNMIGSLQEILSGKFPKSLGEVFTATGVGLFPAPEEIKLKCSCPDWAVMCKHVAATLYGIGVRLDENPELFFTLRGVNLVDLVSLAVKKRKSELLESASKKKKTSRSIKVDDSKLSALFNIELVNDVPNTAKTTTKKIVSSTLRKKKIVKKKKAGKVSKKT